MSETLFDVLEIDMKTNLVEIMAENKTERNAEAIEKMAVMRRGCEKAYFASVAHGLYKNGEKWTGASK